MGVLEAIILGIIQGLTEFLPVSSSGHLEIGKVLLGVEAQESLSFTVAVHGATVLSTIVVFWKDIISLLQGIFKFRWNDETQFIAKIAVSMIPVGVVGVFFKDQVEAFFTGNLMVVGAMLMVTALLLSLTVFVKPRNERPIGFVDSLVIGIAQACAVMPGLSRSGSTIATGMLLGNNKSDVARFSFLMVLVPIIGANLLDVMDGSFAVSTGEGLPIFAGFIAAFVSGYLACSWMIKLVKRGKLLWFAVYCAIVGSVAIVTSLIN
ncbi:MAG: undecaprenyl-diphosphate phosphatase [Tenuifilaceae bacterium]|jgi:undecaprenyl-diphosphatase|nr:undecaprenyl-diphosphate phosphatase [Tenuifilaceae bacterium]